MDNSMENMEEKIEIEERRVNHFMKIMEYITK